MICLQIFSIFFFFFFLTFWNDFSNILTLSVLAEVVQEKEIKPAYLDQSGVFVPFCAFLPSSLVCEKAA